MYSDVPWDFPPPPPKSTANEEIQLCQNTEVKRGGGGRGTDKQTAKNGYANKTKNRRGLWTLGLKGGQYILMWIGKVHKNVLWDTEQGEPPWGLAVTQDTCPGWPYPAPGLLRAMTTQPLPKGLPRHPHVDKHAIWMTWPQNSNFATDHRTQITSGKSWPPQNNCNKDWKSVRPMSTKLTHIHTHLGALSIWCL